MTYEEQVYLDLTKMDDTERAQYLQQKNVKEVVCKWNSED